MNALEKLGLEVAAKRWLRVKDAEGRLLAAFLIAGPDALLTTDAVAARLRPPCGGWDDLLIHDVGSDGATNRVRVRVCRLRSALLDVGYSAAIKTVPGEGYFMPAAQRNAIRAALEASL